MSDLQQRGTAARAQSGEEGAAPGPQGEQGTPATPGTQAAGGGLPPATAPQGQMPLVLDAPAPVTHGAPPPALELPVAARADGAAPAPLPELQVEAGVVLPEVPHAVASTPPAASAAPAASASSGADASGMVTAEAAQPAHAASPADAAPPADLAHPTAGAPGPLAVMSAHESTPGAFAHPLESGADVAPSAPAAGSAQAGPGDAAPAEQPPYARPLAPAQRRAAAPEAEPHTFLFWAGLVLAALPAALLYKDNALDARGIGEAVGAMLFIMGFVCGLAWLVMRKRSARAQGIVMLIAGVIAMGSSSAQLIERLSDAHNAKLAMQHLQAAFEEARAVDGGALKLPPRPPLPEVPQAYRHGTAAYFLALADAVDAATRRGLALNRRMAALDFTDVLTPSRLSSVAAVRRSRALVAEFRAVVSERDVAGRESMQAITRIIETADIREEVRAAEKRVLASRTTETQRELAEVSRANLESAVAIDRALQLVERNLGRGVNVTGGRLMFNSQALLDEYRAMIAEVRRAATEEEGVVARVMQARQQRMQVVSDRLKGRVK